MRLTLRTLLAYLDNALPPAESQEIAQKLQTSPVATKLAGRIGELLAADDCGPAPGLDPNLVAGYLDNTLQPEQIMEVETLCLASGSQIEEAAACHRLLFRGTIAEPTISAAGRDRLYALTPRDIPAPAAPGAGLSTTPEEEAALREPRWYYRLFGQEFGPVPIDLLIQVIASGQLKPLDEVRADPNTTWVRVRDFLAGPAAADKNVASAPAPAPEAPAAADEWFCQSKNVGPDPYTFAELLFHARQGLLEPNDQIRFGSQGAWRRAGSIGRLMAEFPFQPMSAASAPSPAPQANEHKPNNAAVPVRNDAPAAVPTGILTPAVPATQAPATAPSDEWYVQLGTMTCGPMKLAELLEWVRAGRLQPTDGVRRGATSNWVYAGMLPMLLAAGQAFPAPPTAMPPARS
jgi:hypothetical protein